eukprot:CAMPEP_0197870830 /NCGR_PEP_ID=MMETSP1439-20131203/1390_1 /TAXON_ID=66791 /ORGANISM="Gonyaulax spinifera, Strain CCMP409" /LENGTH=121 /DNA_ID=CAMNT_0043489733 /DNA_START=87 /DNA_END=449 /DNA_ORIENTATION=+
MTAFHRIYALAELTLRGPASDDMRGAIRANLRSRRLEEQCEESREVLQWLMALEAARLQVWEQPPAGDMDTAEAAEAAEDQIQAVGADVTHIVFPAGSDNGLVPECHDQIQAVGADVTHIV